MDMATTTVSPSVSTPLAELSREERIQLAITRWKESDGTISKSKIAKEHNVATQTLFDRIKGKKARSASHENQQRLTIEEEQVLLGWILGLQAGGWSTRVAQIRRMAQEILTTKGDSKPIGVNWTQKFLSRHPEIKIKTDGHVPPPTQPSSYNITIRPNIPPEGTLCYSGPDGDLQFEMTPQDTAQIHQILQKTLHEARRAQQEARERQVT